MKAKCSVDTGFQPTAYATRKTLINIRSRTSQPLYVNFWFRFLGGGGGGEGQHGSFCSSVQYMVPSRRLGSLQVLLLPCLCVLFILFSLYVCCCATFAHPCSVLCVLTQFAMFQFVSSTMTHQKKAAVRFELEKALPSGEWWHFDFDLPEGADVHGSQ